MNELTKRVLFALPAASFFLWVAWIGVRPFELLIGMIGLFTIWEIQRILTQAGNPGYFLVSLLIAASLWLGAHLPDWYIVSVASILILFTLWALLDKKNGVSRRWLSTLFCGVYAPVGFLMLVYIRGMGEQADGFWLTLTLLFMIWGNDVFAYFGGKSFGKRPLAPAISPKKTWEGFWSGFIGSGAGLLIVFFIADPFPIPLAVMLPAIVLVSVLGPLGDITASSLKRLANVKDSSGLLPGHGGFFDRFDSLLLTAPFFYFYLYLLF